MIRTEEKPAAASSPPALPQLETDVLKTDPAELVATAMIELAAQGVTVTLDSLDIKIESLTRDEIAIVAERATAIAKRRLREAERRLS